MDAHSDHDCLVANDFQRPNLRYGRRMPVRRAAWDLAWWLMLRVVMRGYTNGQRVATIHSALGRFGYAYSAVQSPHGITVTNGTGTTASNVHISGDWVWSRP